MAQRFYDSMHAGIYSAAFRRVFVAERNNIHPREGPLRGGARKT